MTAEAISLLQDLGLQEYEARCFLALTQLHNGTAKEVHDVSDVPRTRVYDAMRVLESQGLVEIHHGSPQQYRSVGIDEATRILRQKYDRRIESLEAHLEAVETREDETGDDPVQEVWAVTGHDTIGARTASLIEEADSEVAVVVVDESLLTDAVTDALRGAIQRGVTAVLGARTEALTERLAAEFPDARVFETALDFLIGPDEDGVAISRILLVDRTVLLVGSYYPERSVGDEDGPTEQAVYARGLGNGIVVLLRRLIASGMDEGVTLTIGTGDGS